MRFLGFELKRASKREPRGETAHTSASQGVWSPYFKGYIARVVSPALFEIMRESIPVLDAAIDRLTALDGVPKVEGNNQALVDEINEWAENVQCGDTEHGLAAFVRNWRGEVHEQGFGLGEWVYSPDGRDIVRLNIADSKAVQFGIKDDESMGVYFSPVIRPRFVRDAMTNGVGDILSGRAGSNLLGSVLRTQGFKELDMSNKRVMAYRAENGGDPYGVSLMRSMEFCSKILLTIQNGTLNSWERFGDPSFHVNYKSSSRMNGPTLEERRAKIAVDFNTTMLAKRRGESVDFITAGDKDSDVTIDVIGHNGQVLQIEMPARHVLEQIVAKTGLPPWMLGLIWGTSERLAKFQLELVKQESDTRTSFERPHVEAVISAMLRARGRTWKKGDWHVEYEKPNLADEVAKAQAKFMNAQADAVLANSGAMAGQTVIIENGDNNSDGEASTNRMTFNVHAGQRASNHQAHTHTHTHTHNRLETRPIDNPALDRVEEDVVKSMRDAWHETEQHIIAMLGLPTDAVRNEVTAEGFTFTAADKANISAALASYATAALVHDGVAMGAMQLAYVTAWAQGVIDAYTLSGLSQPVGTFNNDAEVAKLRGVTQGVFDTNLHENFAPKLWRILETGTASGENPLNIAKKLSTEFQGFAWKWEQIARSEVAIAHDRARRGEWASEVADGVTDDAFDWLAAPDACPVCIGMVSGFNGNRAPYTLKTLPRLVLDTHPSDRCSIAPHVTLLA